MADTPAPPARPPMPPEPAVSQPAPLHDLKGKVAYITASSDGIGLGIARAAANAGMKVCVGFRSEERLKAALPLFKKGSAILPVKHDVTDRDGWAKVLEQIKGEFGKLHLLVNNAGSKTRAKISEVSDEEYAQFYKHIAHAWDEPKRSGFRHARATRRPCRQAARPRPPSPRPPRPVPGRPGRG